jgi:hypothetical protein
MMPGKEMGITDARMRLAGPPPGMAGPTAGRGRVVASSWGSASPRLRMWILSVWFSLAFEAGLL